VPRKLQAIDVRPGRGNAQSAKEVIPTAYCDNLAQIDKVIRLFRPDIR
jgi:hypothetical protein